MLATDQYQQRLVSIASQHGILEGVTADELDERRTRQELGISSLNVIMLMVDYLEEHGDGTDFKPEWVARLEDVGGIISVMQEIDEGGKA